MHKTKHIIFSWLLAGCAGSSFSSNDDMEGDIGIYRSNPKPTTSEERGAELSSDAGKPDSEIIDCTKNICTNYQKDSGNDIENITSPGTNTIQNNPANINDAGLSEEAGLVPRPFHDAEYGAENDSSNPDLDSGYLDSKVDRINHADSGAYDATISDVKIFDSYIPNDVIDAGNNCSKNNLGLTEDCPAQSCKQIKDKTNTNTNGKFFIKIDANNSFIIEVYCDMIFDGGGWVLFYSALAINSPSANPCTIENNVFPGSATHMSPETLKSLADNAEQVHIRTRNNLDRYITSTPNSGPIQNLRELKVVSMRQNLLEWFGPRATDSYLCSSSGGSENYINNNYGARIFHSSGCVTGLHLGMFDGGCLSRWRFNHANENMEAYLR